MINKVKRCITGQKLILLLLITTAITSCNVFKTVTSNTTIEPNNSFVLGKNTHGAFNVKLKNVSANAVTVYFLPKDGVANSIVIVQPNKTIKVNVEANTALVVENKSNAQASVDLLVKGDTGLSMGYKN
jgi:hypothetical protein